ncbi:MAG TPA: hypothetical protein VLE97_07115 [Gaiellaceae bacterium]|nr:hypothetical protein [Gaiellaceae bacterium]
MAARSSKCIACGARTTASAGYCQRCKSLRHHGYKRIKAEDLILDQAGGSWWIWDRRGDVLVSGKPTAGQAAIALAAGDVENGAEDVPSHSHATRKTKAQLDREIAQFVSEREQSLPPIPRTSHERALRDASRLSELWTKHVSASTVGLDVDRLHDVLRREVQVAKRGVATGQVSRGLLTELRSELAEVGSMRKRRR